MSKVVNHDVENSLASARDVSITQIDGESFQQRVKPWMLECFGGSIAADTDERNHRFLEESLELVQACGGDAEQAHQMVDYVFGRNKGDPQQEVGGVMVTLAALCTAHQIDMHDCADTELDRVWTKMEQIRAKHASKPAHLTTGNTV